MKRAGSGRIAALSLVAVLAGAGVLALVSGASEVERKGQTSRTLLEHVVAGHLRELNGRYKLRATETDYAPGGSIGVHQHAGPGIRYVLAGELTYIQPDRTTTYKSGDAFFESGDTTHTAENRTPAVVRVLNFEFLPAGWTGPSAALPESLAGDPGNAPRR